MADKSKSDKKRKKLVIVGDGGCGKTCLLTVFSKGTFPDVYVPTVFENDVKDIEIDNNEIVELALWDTAGQEGFARLRPLSYRAADVVMIAFALNNSDSLDNVVNYWLPEVKEHCPKVPIVIVATKSDLREGEDGTIESSKGQAICEKIGGKHYIETSAKCNSNVEETFKIAARLALQFKSIPLNNKPCCSLL